MAVRQVIPDFEPALMAPEVDGEAVPRYRQPSMVGFRSGADLRDVVERVGKAKSISVDAAVGAGKSVRLPTELANGLGKLVVQVFPSHYLAGDIAAYVSSLGRAVKFIGEVADEYPESGVACIGAACLVAKWLSVGAVIMPDCVVYHDESHESDAYTYLVKKLAASCPGVSCYVTATATANPGGYRSAEPAGQLVRKVYPRQSSDTWDIYGDGPWGVNSIASNALIYEDNKVRAERLVSEYQMAGFLAYRLHSRMKSEVFEMAMQQHRGSASKIVVLVADYSFRSGYTFQVDTIIDTAQVEYMTVEDGRPIRKTRLAYELESYQAAGRGARVEGLVTQYYAPDIDLPMRICDLEVVEMQVAALIFRLLGYEPPQELRLGDVLGRMVPRRLVTVLRGGAPLVTVPQSQLVPFDEFFTPAGRRSPFLQADVVSNNPSMDMRDFRVSADTAMRYGQGPVRRQAFVEQAEVVQPEPLRVHHRADSGVSVSSMEDCADAISALVAYEDTVDVIEIGRYYYAVGCSVNSVSSSAFPDGVDSVCKMFASDKSASIQYGLSSYNRGVAVTALLGRYNVRTCELRVLTEVINGARTRASGKDPGAVRDWARSLSERMSYIVADLHVLASYLSQVTDDFCGLAVMPPMVAEETEAIALAFSSLDALPGVSMGPEKEFLQSFRSDWAQTVGQMQSVSPGVRQLGQGNHMDHVPMSTTGRGMRASGAPRAVKWVTKSLVPLGVELQKNPSNGQLRYARNKVIKPG